MERKEKAPERRSVGLVVQYFFLFRFLLFFLKIFFFFIISKSTLNATGYLYRPGVPGSQGLRRQKGQNQNQPGMETYPDQSSAGSGHSAGVESRGGKMPGRKIKSNPRLERM